MKSSVNKGISYRDSAGGSTIKTDKLRLWSSDALKPFFKPSEKKYQGILSQPGGQGGHFWSNFPFENWRDVGKDALITDVRLCQMWKKKISKLCNQPTDFSCRARVSQNSKTIVVCCFFFSYDPSHKKINKRNLELEESHSVFHYTR